MAYGAVSKPWHQSPSSDFSTLGYPAKKSPSLTSFNNAVTDDDEILEQLNVKDFEVRLRTLNRLRTTALSNEWWFKKFSKKLELFKAFSNVLADANWEIQHQCIKFLLDTMKDYGHDLEWCMAVVVPILVTKLASQKITVRRVTVQALCAYGLTVESTHSLQKALVEFGLQKDPRMAKEVLKEIPNLFAADFRSYNWSILCDGLTRILLSANDAEIVDLILVTMERMLTLVGQQEFNTLIHSLPPAQRNNYEVLLLERGTRNSGAAKFTDPTLGQHTRKSPENNSDGGKQFRYGIIPLSIIEQIDNEADWQIRFNGLERLKVIIENLSESDAKKLQPHLFSYLNLIGNVLDDLSIKVIVITLEILRTSVSKLKKQLEPHLQHTVAVMGKHFGNQKVVVKQLNMMTGMELMKHLHPKPVIGPLCTFLQHRNSRVKEEALNIITVAMLRFASGEFNLLAIAHVLAPLLADAKRRVRLAAFECSAVLAYSMGYAKLEPLYKCIREVEQTLNVTGLMTAVQAKLTKRQLPKVKYDGLLDYSEMSLAPHDNVSVQNGVPPNADVNWIMSAGIGPGSAMSRSLSPLRVRAQIPPPANPTNQPSRVLSAGKNRQKLPWESTAKNGAQEPKIFQNGKNDMSMVSRSTNVTDPQNGPGNIKKGSPLFVKPSNQNGRSVVLSPIDVKPPQSKISGAVSAQSISVSTKTLIRADSPDLDPNESLNNVKWSAAKKREQQNRKFEKAQSIESVLSVTSDNYKHPWDEAPIKPATTKPLDNNFENSNPHAIQSPRKSIVQNSPRKIVPQKKIELSFRRHSADSNSPEPIPKMRPPVQVKKQQPTSPRKKLENQRSLVGKKALPPSPVKTVKSNVPDDMNRPYANPDQALQNALKKLSSEEWEDKVEGLNAIQRLAQYNTNTLNSDVHSVVVALNAEARNLRSSVSKPALGCYCYLFNYLKKNMDPEVEKICQVLVAKTGDASNAFIREDALKALESMVDVVTPYKALFGLTATGASHKNSVIRGACSQLVQRIVENMGSEKVLACQKDFVEKILLTSMQFANDSQPQPRMHGKNTLAMLSQDPDFERTLGKTLNPVQQNTIKNIVGAAKFKSGVSVSSKPSGVIHRAGSIRRKTKLPDEAADSLLSAEKELSSNNWEERYKGVNRFKQLCESYGSYVGNNVKMLETYMQRLNDINGKVALQALENLPFILIKIQPHMADALRPVSTEMIKNLNAQLPSKNDDIRKLAEKGLDASIKTLEICQNIYSSKQKLVQMHAPTVLADLLKSQSGGDADVKQATVDFAKVLSKVMGRNILLEQSSFGPREKAILENMI